MRIVEISMDADLTFMGDLSIDAWIQGVDGGMGAGGVLAPIADKWDLNAQIGLSLFVDQPLPAWDF